MAYSLNPSGSLPRVIKVFLIANVAVYFVDLITQGRYFHTWFSLDPDRITHQFEIWRLGTYLFVHNTNAIVHILFNMLTLWMFGTPLVESMGERKFTWFYFATGIFSGLCTMVFYSLTDNPSTVVGASGALFGLLFAYAKFFPRQEIAIFFLFMVQARYAVMIFGAVELASLLLNDGIAHITHLGGVLFAWLYFMFEERGAQMLFQWQNRKVVKQQIQIKKSAQELGQVMVDIDPILKKISESGMASLTAEEKEKLDRASELKRKQKSKVISLDEYRKRK